MIIFFLQWKISLMKKMGYYSHFYKSVFQKVYQIWGFGWLLRIVWIVTECLIRIEFFLNDEPAPLESHLIYPAKWWLLQLKYVSAELSSMRKIWILNLVTGTTFASFQLTTTSPDSHNCCKIMERCPAMTSQLFQYSGMNPLGP